jgi:hypothetical protein
MLVEHSARVVVEELLPLTCLCSLVAVASCSLGGDVAVNSGSTAQVIEKDQKAGAAMFNVIDNLLLPPDELASVSVRQS